MSGQPENTTVRNSSEAASADIAAGGWSSEAAYVDVAAGGRRSEAISADIAADGRSSEAVPADTAAGGRRPRRRKALHQVASFPTTADAMTAESVCQALGITGRIIPLPGTIRADCGLAWLIAPGTLEAFQHAAEGRFTVAGIHDVMMYEVQT